MATYKKLLKNRAGDTIIPVIGIDTDSVSSVLCVAVNTTTLSGVWRNKAVWTAGDWTQYGALAKTSGNKHIIEITAPQNETWTVMLDHMTGPARPKGNSWSYSGIVELNSSLNIVSYLTSSVTGTNANDFDTQSTSTVVTIQPGSTRYFSVYVGCGSDSGTYAWQGGGQSTSTTAWEFGNSCVLKATLLQRTTVS